MAVETRDGRKRQGTTAGGPAASPTPMKRTNSLKAKLAVAVEKNESEKKEPVKRAGSLQRAASYSGMTVQSPQAKGKGPRVAASPSTPGSKRSVSGTLPSPVAPPTTPTSDKKPRLPPRSPSSTTKALKSPKLVTTTTAPTLLQIFKWEKGESAFDAAAAAEQFPGLRVITEAAVSTEKKRISKPPPKKVGTLTRTASPRKSMSPKKRNRAAKEQHPKMMAFKQAREGALELDVSLENAESEGSETGDKACEGTPPSGPAEPEASPTPSLKSCIMPYSLVPTACPTQTLPQQHVHVAKILESCCKSPHSLARAVNALHAADYSFYGAEGILKTRKVTIVEETAA